jgi:hypothetical protein
MSHGDHLGTALAIFTEQLAALRRKPEHPTPGQGRPSGADQASLIEASPIEAMERSSNGHPF